METKVNGTPDAWRERLAAQRASGQSIRAWCRDNHQHEYAFYWWRSRLTSVSSVEPGLSPNAAKHPRQQTRPVEFAEVVIDRIACEPIVLRLGNGRELVLPASMSADRVAQLIRALEGAA